VRAQQGIHGFIAGDPELGWHEGTARLYIRVGINHYKRRDSGAGWEKLAPTFHHLVQFGPAAELSSRRFRRGDDFIALGYVRSYSYTVNGETRDEERFVAYRLSHDPNTTTYEINREPSSTDHEAQQAAGRSAASPAQAAQPSTPTVPAEPFPEESHVRSRPAGGPVLG
jgi:single-strand DNA-binding protein